MSDRTDHLRLQYIERDGFMCKNSSKLSDQVLNNLHNVYESMH